MQKIKTKNITVSLRYYQNVKWSQFFLWVSPADTYKKYKICLGVMNYDNKEKKSK